MSAIVAAATGIPVVKHGNRAASSASGSSDVLGALGIDLTLSPERVEVLAEAGITFAFASAFHPASVTRGRRERNSACRPSSTSSGRSATRSRRGQRRRGRRLDRVPLITGVFQTRGATALVFRGDDGLDELTTTGHSRVWEVSRGDIHEHDLDPETSASRSPTSTTCSAAMRSTTPRSCDACSTARRAPCATSSC
jgi:anthranilate phosphoribosyltransferase